MAAILDSRVTFAAYDDRNRLWAMACGPGGAVRPAMKTGCWLPTAFFFFVGRNCCRFFFGGPPISPIMMID